MKDPKDENIEPNEGRDLARRVARQWVRDEEVELIPITHLSLDVTEPVAGWELDLFERGVEIVDDDFGRPCVRREVLGELLREERELLARIENESAAAPERPPVAAGLPALRDGSPMAAVMAHDPAYVTPSAEFGFAKPDFLAAELEAGARHLAAARAEAESKEGG